MLDLQRIPVKVNPLSVGEHVQPVPPLRMRRAETNLDGGGAISCGGHGRQLSCAHGPVLVTDHLLKAALHVQLQAG